MTMKMCNHRIPEPVRQADMISRKEVKLFKSEDDKLKAVTNNVLEFLSLKNNSEKSKIEPEKNSES